ncbi:MAG: AAA family ATPase, partial [Rhodospirillaceae bacterium]|nr:AAA family ATPase [Rhodospirillaceae bacterium]
MTNVQDQSDSGASAPAGQRRQVTVLFADMAGYTALSETLGEEQTYLLMQRVQRELNEAVHSHSGTVQEMAGDGIMALFGAPIAVENAPLRACQAAVELQSRMTALADEFERGHGVAPRFRVGIHSGALVVGEVGDDRQSSMTALGDTVNVASRIESAAEAGTIFMSAATQALVEGFVDSTFIGERTLKGKTEAQQLWCLDAIRAGVTRFDISRSHGLTPLVGRERELDQLRKTWGEVSQGAVRCVTILGEPGIGKSRLAFEFRENINDEKVFFLEGHCAAGTQETPFAPLMDIVRRAFRIGDAAAAGEAEQRLQQGLEMLGIDPAESRPYLMNLLGFSQGTELDQIAGETLGIRTRDAVIEMLRERCRVSPTILIIEDLQWIDTATQGLLTRIIEQEPDLALFVIATARTGHRPPWRDAKNASEIALNALSASGTEALLQGRLDTRTPPESLIKLVIEKSEGNPLFAEAIISYLQDSGAVSGQGDTHSYTTGQGGAALPVAIENLLMNRFDRLDSGPRAVLEAAAVTGKRFTAKQLQR